MFSSFRPFGLLLGIAALAATVPGAGAAGTVNAWTNAAGNLLWSDPLNWAASVAPGATHSAQFDSGTGATEKILLPNLGKAFGNFGGCNINPEETWVVDCLTRAEAGKLNLFIARIHWAKPNRLASQ
jgi:hypothetical protein